MWESICLSLSKSVFYAKSFWDMIKRESQKSLITTLAVLSSPCACRVHLWLKNFEKEEILFNFLGRHNGLMGACLWEALFHDHLTMHEWICHDGNIRSHVKLAFMTYQRRRIAHWSVMKSPVMENYIIHSKSLLQSEG